MTGGINFFATIPIGTDIPTEARSCVYEVLTAALRAVDPADAIRACVSWHGNALHVNDTEYALLPGREVCVFGTGKASAVMAATLEEIIGERITTGWVNTKYSHAVSTRWVTVHEAGHPLPDEQGLIGTRRMLELLRQTGQEDLILCPISGGGSALWTLPVEGVSLADLATLTDALLRSGATINEFNAVRKHLSQVQGGQFVKVAHPRPVVSLILSDVVGSPLDVVASGPTVPDPTTFADAWAVLEKYELVGRIPLSVEKHLQRGLTGEIPETPKPGDSIFARTQNVVIADVAMAAEAAVSRARELGFHTLLLTTWLGGEAREVGYFLAGIARTIHERGEPLSRPACVVAGGETTVTVRGSGLGGRNQELALAAALGIEGLPSTLIVAWASDGGDGPTVATGAIVDGGTVSRARLRGLVPERYLQNNDSHSFFRDLGELWVTGPTRTNVNDLTLIFAL